MKLDPPKIGDNIRLFCTSIGLPGKLTTNSHLPVSSVVGLGKLCQREGSQLYICRCAYVVHTSCIRRAIHRAYVVRYDIKGQQWAITSKRKFRSNGKWLHKALHLFGLLFGLLFGDRRLSTLSVCCRRVDPPARVFLGLVSHRLSSSRTRRLNQRPAQIQQHRHV